MQLIMKLAFILPLFCSLYLLPVQAQKKWSLQDCIDYAVENNIAVKKSKLDQINAELNLKQQQYNRLPSLSANGGITLSNGTAIDPITSDFISQNIFSNSYNLNANVILFQGNTLNLQIDKNELLVKQSQLYQQQAENNIVLSVLEAYLQGLYYQEGITIANYTAASAKEELDFAQVKYNNGALAQLDLTNVETQYAQSEYNVVNSQNLYELQLLKIKQLLELDPVEDFTIETLDLDDLAQFTPDKQDVYTAAIAHLPDLQLYDQQGEILEKELSLYQANRLPTLSLNAGLNTGYSNSMSRNYWNQVENNFNKSVGLTLSIPIFSKFQNKTNVKVAKIAIEQNELDKVSASKTLYASIETAWQNARGNQAQQMASKVARDNAKKAYELANKKYEFGGLTTTELLVSRNAYLTNEQTYLQSKYMAVLYQNLLSFYQGRKFTSN